MLVRLFMCCLPVMALGAANFSYDRCNVTHGPSAWIGQCNPNQRGGTPIDLCAAVPFPSDSIPTLSISGYSTSRKVKFYNPGATLEVSIIDNNPQLQAGPLAFTVGRSSDRSNQTWIMAQMHLHWGRNANEGSEHFLQGQPYPLEAHFVHFNSIYANLSAAVRSGNSDALLVVGTFFDLSNRDVDTIQVIANAVGQETQTPTELSTPVTLSDIFDGTGDFYSYPGGLTTPGCNEVVTWIVMSEPKPIRQSTLSKIWQATTNPPLTASSKRDTNAELLSKFGNFRPLQDRAGRTVYYTGGATAACTNVSESFLCSNAVNTSPSSMLALLWLIPLLLLFSQ